MSRGQNTIKRSEVSTTPILLKYSASYDSSSFIANGITVNRGVNTSFNSNGVTYLNYALVKQLYYQEYLTGSTLFSSSYWNPSIQSTAALGTFDNDYRYFPTSSSAQVTVIGIPRTAFGEQLARKSLRITGSTYLLIDDGNGNVIDTYTTGSQPSTNVAYASNGVRLYYPGYTINGTGAALDWNTSNAGGSYAGTFWANPVTANKTGRLNYTGFWSAKSLLYFGDFATKFDITVTAGTYYFGIGCDNYASLYVDDNLILSQIIPDATGNGGNYRYWHIYPVNLTVGTHKIKFIGTNAGIPDPGNPGAMGIEVYNNTQTQISASITAEPLGSSIPGGLNVIYSSKDYLSNTTYTQNNHVGNVLYSQGVIIITDEEYQNALIPIPGTTTSTTSTTTTATPTTTTSTTTSTTTAAPTTTTTTTSTTTSTTTVAPTTTTTSTTSTTTTEVPTTTTTTTSTTTSTTTVAPTTTTSTTTTTTTLPYNVLINFYTEDVSGAFDVVGEVVYGNVDASITFDGEFTKYTSANCSTGGTSGIAWSIGFTASDTQGTIKRDVATSSVGSAQTAKIDTLTILSPSTTITSNPEDVNIGGTIYRITGYLVCNPL